MRVGRSQQRLISIPGLLCVLFCVYVGFQIFYYVYFYVNCKGNTKKDSDPKYVISGQTDCALRKPDMKLGDLIVILIQNA